MNIIIIFGNIFWILTIYLIEISLENAKNKLDSFFKIINDIDYEYFDSLYYIFEIFIHKYLILIFYIFFFFCFIN